jgi:hypothetical protein
MGLQDQQVQRQWFSRVSGFQGFQGLGCWVLGFRVLGFRVLGLRVSGFFLGIENQQVQRQRQRQWQLLCS